MPEGALVPIGYLATPFRDRFGIPRQPQLAPHALGRLRLLRPYDRAEAVRGARRFFACLAQLPLPPHCRPVEPDGAAAAPRRQRTRRRVCQPQPLSPQPPGAVSGRTVGDRHARRRAVDLWWGRLARRHAGARHQAVHPFRRKPTRCPSGFRRRSAGATAGRFHGAGAGTSCTSRRIAGRTWPRCCAKFSRRTPVPPMPTTRCASTACVSTTWRSSGVVPTRGRSSNRSRLPPKTAAGESTA
jgi:hypothetical protein